MSEPHDELRWRVPTTGDPRLLRLAFAQIGMGAVVCALLLLVAAPREWLVPALLGIIPLALWLAYRRWRKFHEEQEGPDNVRLDRAGLHWLDAEGRERTFERSSIVGYTIGRDPDTLRPLPSLVLHLDGGLASQPIELHPPATQRVVRAWLAANWNVPEQPAEADGEPGYDLAIDVYSECHGEFQEWHWEGTREALEEWMAALEEASELPLAPVGVRPARRVVLARRREPARVALEHDRFPHLDGRTIAGPAELLATIAVRGRETLAEIAPSQAKADASFDVPLSPHSRWTFHLHVREPSG